MATAVYDYPQRVASIGMPVPHTPTLEEKFEVIKDIGDGSFGSVALARVRTAGSHIAKRGTMVAIKTMKKTFDSFGPCLELREVIFLRSLPIHVHLVPALDIFLDSTTKKLHICMEYMDGNLYQLMKAREHRFLDTASVKSILYQILSGLDHIHTNNFFHRDIKPENILISASSPDSGFRRYSSLVTPPSTPSLYTVKIADFGLARETHSKLPYTTYVSTRWYRAPEVLLRAGEYSAPVDIWALGAMAVEIATLKPLFPGGNEVDQVWRVCEIMGSPGNWYSKSGAKMGGGDWRDGTRLAQKLGFSFPKMAPHSMDTILPSPQWPAALSNFVTWCLMWDPKNRPTSLQAMNHEYFADAVDPLTRPKSSSKLLSRKQSGYEPRHKESDGALAQRSSWFRKSLIGRDSTSAAAQPAPNAQLLSPRPSPVRQVPVTEQPKAARPNMGKRATWSNGPTQSMAPMPILPSIKPISPLSNAVTAEARSTAVAGPEQKQPAAAAPTTTEAPQEKSKKIGRQLSLASHGNHYADINTDRALNGLGSPTSGQKESFFSHLRKRARRLSGRNQVMQSPKYEDIEASAGQAPWPASNRSSMMVDAAPAPGPTSRNDFTELDKALQNVRYSLDASSQQLAQSSPQPSQMPIQPMEPATSAPGPTILKRNSSLRHTIEIDTQPISPGPISSRTRRALHLSAHPSNRYETPDEEEELLDEALNGAHRAAHGLNVHHEPRIHAIQDAKLQPYNGLHHSVSVGSMVHNPYPTPSPSGKRNGVLFTNGLMDKPTTPVSIARPRKEQSIPSLWPTPPYEENEWAASASASIFAAGSIYR